jgi:small subunit ribosomal protein S20
MNRGPTIEYTRPASLIPASCRNTHLNRTIGVAGTSPDKYNSRVIGLAIAELFCCVRQSPTFEGVSLANSKSAAKRARVSERRKVRNRRYRSSTRTLVRRAEALISQADEQAAAGAVGNAISLLDRAAAKGVIHPNNAARRKSRLMSKYNSMES